ncbi:TetR/AcrR family transcriptional regulator [Flavobacterium sp.]|uniref:TetR/AcrR family transcriptional regulator n=1 Tax=Flavobacterium sp. TaxID=239 RepID=UPI003D0A2F6C
MKDTKQYILDTAFKLFLKKTFKEVTMKEIVEATDLSKGAFYHYFSSKEQLFREIVETYYLTQMLIGYEQFDQSSLRAFYNDYLNHVDTKENALANEGDTNANYFSLVFEAIRLFPETKVKFAENNALEIKIWSNVIARAKKNGEIKSEMSDENIAQLFLFSVDATSLRLLLLEEKNNRKMLQKKLIGFWDSFYKQLKS